MHLCTRRFCRNALLPILRTCKTGIFSEGSVRYRSRCTDPVQHLITASRVIAAKNTAVPFSPYINADHENRCSSLKYKYEYIPGKILEPSTHEKNRSNARTWGPVGAGCNGAGTSTHAGHGARWRCRRDGRWWRLPAVASRHTTHTPRESGSRVLASIMRMKGGLHDGAASYPAASVFGCCEEYICC